MDNIQLSILMRQFERRLAQAIQHAESMMPDDIERFDERHYEGKSPIPALDPSGWKSKPTGSPVAFGPLLELLHDLDEHASALLGCSDGDG